MNPDQNHSQFQSHEKSVERTLLYYKLFSGGIKKENLRSFLLESQISETELNEVIDSLHRKGKINIDNNVISLRSDLKPFYSKKEKKIDKELLNKLLHLLKSIPFITAIAFSGGTANYGVENHDDIDLFIITRPHTVYIVYIMIHLMSLLFNSRNILCINYLIDETAVEIEIQRDLFTAHQILALKPFKNEDYLNYFLKKNNWIKKHYPNFTLPEEKDHNSSAAYSLLIPVNALLNTLYRMMYKKYLDTRNSGSIILSGNVIKLHTNDYRLKVLNEFNTQWKKYLFEQDKVSLKAV